MDAGETRVADERRQFGAHAAVAPEPSSALPVAMHSPTLPRRQAPPLWSLAVAAGAIRSAFDHELERGNAFLFAPVFMAAGALAYFTMRAEPALAPLLLSFAALGALAAATVSRPLLHALFLAAAMAAAGMLAGKVETLRAATPMLGAEISTRLTARVVRVEHQASGRVRLTLDVVSTERPALRHAPRRVRATARAAPAGLMPGDTVQGIVRLLPPSGPVRPGSYDFAFESYFSGIGAVGFFLAGPDRLTQDAPPALRERLAAQMEGWRARMAGRIESRIGGPEGAVAAALVTGIRAGIPEDLNEAMRITGLYHVISISGLHMALVAGTLMVSMRAGFALFPTFAMRRPVKKYAAAMALAATAFYLVMSGADVAAQRSFIMLAVMLLAVLFDRAALTMRNLAISALIILLLAPHEVMGPSFQMSFAATAALVAAYAGWRDHRDRRSPGRPHRRSALATATRTGMGYAAGLAMTSVVAGLATALFTAWHFQQVSPLGLVANLAAMPVVSVVVMPMAVLASLAMPLGLDAAPLWLMGQGIAAMNAIAFRLAEHSTLDATGAIPLSAVLVLTAALAILTMAGGGLRWAALPLVGAGIGLLAAREIPHAFVSEDARLVAVRLRDGTIAVNRSRPRTFTMQNWQRAFGGGHVVPPRSAGGRRTPAGPPDHAAFACGEGVCLVRLESGALVVHAEDAVSASTLCGRASLLVIADATAANPCGEGATVVITGRDLARWGSAEVRFRGAASGQEPDGGMAAPGSDDALAMSAPDDASAVPEPGATAAATGSSDASAVAESKDGMAVAEAGEAADAGEMVVAPEPDGALPISEPGGAAAVRSTPMPALAVTRARKPNRPFATRLGSREGQPNEVSSFETGTRTKSALRMQDARPFPPSISLASAAEGGRKQPELPWAKGMPAAEPPPLTASLPAISISSATATLPPILRAEVRFAISEPYRPWHEHRRFSREARGLAPYTRPRERTDTNPASPEEQAAPSPPAPTELPDLP